MDDLKPSVVVSSSEYDAFIGCVERELSSLDQPPPPYTKAFYEKIQEGKSIDEIVAIHESIETPESTLIKEKYLNEEVIGHIRKRLRELVLDWTTRGSKGTCHVDITDLDQFVEKWTMRFVDVR